MLDRVARQFHGALAAHARAQEDGQQFRVRQRVRAIFDQAFARPLAGRPILDAHAVLLRRALAGVPVGRPVPASAVIAASHCIIVTARRGVLIWA